MSAVRVHMDWRPFAGLTRDDEDTEVERLIAGAVLEKAVRLHNQDIQRQKG